VILIGTRSSLRKGNEGRRAKLPSLKLTFSHLKNGWLEDETFPCFQVLNLSVFREGNLLFPPRKTGIIRAPNGSLPNPERYKPKRQNVSPLVLEDVSFSCKEGWCKACLLDAIYAALL